jgi:hypothetical protein
VTDTPDWLLCANQAPNLCRHPSLCIDHTSLIPLGWSSTNLTTVDHRTNIAWVVRALLANESRLDRRQDSASVTNSGGVGHWVLATCVVLRVEWARVRGVEVEVIEGRESAISGGPGSDLVTSLLADEVIHIGTNVPASKSGKIPICGDRGDLRVVGVDVGVVGSDEALGNSVSEKDTVNVVGIRVGVVLIESQENQGLGAIEPCIVEKRLEEVLGPCTGNRDGGVVTIIDHIGCDEHPLRKRIPLEVSVELRKILDGG